MSSIVKYEELSFMKTVPEVKDLFENHWKELGQVNGPDKLDVNYELFKLIEDNGAYKFFGAEHNGKKIGYIGFMLSPGLHHKDERYAETDIVYVDKAYRNLGIGKKLIKFAEEILNRNYGIGYLRIQVNANFKQMIPLIESLGYKECDIVYQKKLER